MSKIYFLMLINRFHFLFQIPVQNLGFGPGQISKLIFSIVPIDFGRSNRMEKGRQTNGIN